MGEKLAALLKQQHPEGIDSGVDFKDRTQAAFVVPKGDIAAQKYDLSINRYKEVVYQAEEYEDPKVILKRLKELEKEILADLDELEDAVSWPMVKLGDLVTIKTGRLDANAAEDEGYTPFYMLSRIVKYQFLCF